MKKMVIGAIFALLLITAAILLQVFRETPPEFDVVSMKIVPPEVTVGETAIVRAEVTNSGGYEGTYNAALTIDRVEAETKSVTLVSGETGTVTFSIVKDEAGYYEIAIGNRSSTFAVREALPPAFHISELAINPPEVDPAEQTTITAKVENSGGTGGSYDAELKINDTLEQTTEVIVAAGTHQTLTFSVSKDIPGTYVVALGGLTGQFTVLQPEKPIVIKIEVDEPSDPSCCDPTPG